MKPFEHPSGATVFSPSVRRAEYNRFLSFLNSVAPGTEFIITESLIRLEAVLSPTRNKYVMNFYENQGADRATERKLNRNDIFMVTHGALCLAKQDAVNGNFANFHLHTFPDANFFSGNDGVQDEFFCLETVYNGKLSLVTKPVQRVEALPTNLFRFAPEKHTALVTATQLNDECAKYGPLDTDRGFREIQPNLILSGAENHQVELELGAGDISLINGGVDNSNVAVDTTNVVVFLALGFEAKNAATAASRWSLGAY